MQENRSNSTILWAIDLLGENLVFQKAMAKALKLWVKQRDLVIQPIYVLQAPRNIPHPDHHPSIMESIHPQIEKCFAQFIKTVQIPQVTPIKTLVPKEFSVRGSVEALLHYAHEIQADSIALTTHSKKGMSRLLYGSFAEAALLQSDIPLLILNPKSQPIQKLNHILFPTDLSQESRKIFQLVLKTAKELQLKLTLIHSSEFIGEEVQLAYGSAKSYFDSLKQDLKKRKDRLHELAEQAQKEGLKTEEIFLEEETDLVKTILSIAKKKNAQIIAMASKCSPTEAALGGSLTRKVVRATDRLVWAIHSE